MSVQAVEQPQNSEPPLPGPADRPGADVVIYDGQCQICSRQVRRLAGWDRYHRLAFVSLHDPFVAQQYPDLKPEALRAEMYVVDRQGQRHGGADAFRYLSRRVPKLWWLSALMHFPGSMPLWRWVYRQIAARRYWFGRTTTCDGDACRIRS